MGDSIRHMAEEASSTMPWRKKKEKEKEKEKEEGT